MYRCSEQTRLAGEAAELQEGVARLESLLTRRDHLLDSLIPPGSVASKRKLRRRPNSPDCRRAGEVERLVEEEHEARRRWEELLGAQFRWGEAVRLSQVQIFMKHVVKPVGRLRGISWARL